MPRHIFIGSHRFIDRRNAIDPDTLYEGDPDQYEFPAGTRMAEKLQLIQASLHECGTRLDHIQAGRLVLQTRSERPLILLAWNNEQTFVWQKYRGESTHSGFNYVYVHGKRVNLSVWLNGMSSEERIAAMMNP